MTSGLEYFLDPAFLKILGRMGFGKKLTREEIDYWRTQTNILEEWVNDVKALIEKASTEEDLIVLGEKLEALDKATFGKRQAASA